MSVALGQMLQWWPERIFQLNPKVGAGSCWLQQSLVLVSCAVQECTPVAASSEAASTEWGTSKIHHQSSLLKGRFAQRLPKERLWANLVDGGPGNPGLG